MKPPVDVDAEWWVNKSVATDRHDGALTSAEATPALTLLSPSWIPAYMEIFQAVSVDAGNQNLGVTAASPMELG